MTGRTTDRTTDRTTTKSSTVTSLPLLGHLHLLVLPRLALPLLARLLDIILTDPGHPTARLLSTSPQESPP